MESIFTVQPSKNKKYGIYRLGLDRETSNMVSKYQMIKLKLSNKLIISAKIVCGPPSKKTYDVNHSELNLWIKKNEFHCYQDKKPTKLLFDFDKTNCIFTFKSKMKTLSVTRVSLT